MKIINNLNTTENQLIELLKNILLASQLNLKGALPFIGLDDTEFYFDEFHLLGIDISLIDIIYSFDEDFENLDLDDFEITTIGEDFIYGKTYILGSIKLNLGE